MDANRALLQELRRERAEIQGLASGKGKGGKDADKVGGRMMRDHGVPLPKSMAYLRNVVERISEKVEAGELE